MCIRQKINSYLRLMRFHRPIGTLLLLWPTAWALCLALEKVNWPLIIIFTLGVIFMRAAGCIINDIADRNFDGAVWRTKDRPLVTGEVKLIEAITLLIVLLALSASLLFWLPPFVWLLAIVAVLITAIYPLMKRYIQVPQFVLGIAFAWGIPMVFAAVFNTVPVLGWYVFFIAAIWIIMFDTQYAMADRADDLKIGIKSTAILFAQQDRLIIGLLQISMLGLLIYLGIWQSYNIFYYLSLMAVASLFIYQQYLTLNREPKKCLQAFLNNQWVGLIIFLGMMLNKI